MTLHQPPQRIRTARLLVRAWRSKDAPLLKNAIDASLEHLQRWMRWAMAEPSPVETIASRLARFADDFAAGRDWGYGLFTLDERSVIGGTGLHPRIGPGGLEIGYWIHVGHTRRGYATEAAAAMTRTGFEMPDVARMEIRCDPRNLDSAAVPKRLAYRHVQTLVNETVTPSGEPRDTMIWQLTRSEFIARGG